MVDGELNPKGSGKPKSTLAAIGMLAAILLGFQVTDTTKPCEQSTPYHEHLEIQTER